MNNRKRKWGYSVPDIAGACGRKISTVRKDVRDGKLNPENLKDVAKYITGFCLAVTERQMRVRK